MDRCMYVCTCVRTYVWMDGRMDGWMDGILESAYLNIRHPWRRTEDHTVYSDRGRFHYTYCTSSYML